MFNSIKKLFGGSAKEEPQQIKPQAPSVLGLHLGGSFTIDSLKLSLLEPSLTIEGASPEQRITAIGEVNLDQQRKIIRFYTDDEGWLQVQMDGEEVQEVSLWYFFDAKGITDSDWKSTLEGKVATGTYILDENEFKQSWEGNEVELLTEKTYSKDGTVTETDQFCMAYFREIDSKHASEELLLISAEEKENALTHRLEHELVRSTGVMLDVIDIKTN